MTYQQRVKHNIAHKNRLARYRKAIHSSYNLLTRSKFQAGLAYERNRKFNDARQHGLVVVPKEMALQHKLNYKNCKEAYLANQRHFKQLKADFERLKFGKKPLNTDL